MQNDKNVLYIDLKEGDYMEVNKLNVITLYT